MAEAAKKNAKFDPGLEPIGAVYAKALLAAAEKAGQADAAVEELESLAQDVLAELPQFRAALESPRIGTEEKIALLDRAFSGRMSALGLNFLKVLARHGRLDCLRAIAAVARKLLNELRGRREVLVRTASPLSQPLRQRIVDRLGAMLGKEVILQTEIDPEMLGGVTVRVGDTVYDGSVSAQLALMRAESIERTAKRIQESLERFAVSS
jgi:F-type H+-transporting ATPase subunit delta